MCFSHSRHFNFKCQNRLRQNRTSSEWKRLIFFTLSCVFSGVLQRETEDRWEHGHGYEAAEPAGHTRQGQAVRPGANCLSSGQQLKYKFVGKRNPSWILLINKLIECFDNIFDVEIWPIKFHFQLLPWYQTTLCSTYRIIDIHAVGFYWPITFKSDLNSEKCGESLWAATSVHFKNMWCFSVFDESCSQNTQCASTCCL